MSNRGKVTLNQDGFLMRLYNNWRDMKGWDKTRRSQIDLCHFMRVVMIFVWFRLFFQRVIIWKLTAFEALLFTGLVAAYVTALSLWTATTLWATGGALVGVIFSVGVIFLVRAFLAWRMKDPQRADDLIYNVCYWSMIWLWWPASKFGAAAAWVWRKVVYPAGNWFFNRRYWVFSDTVTPAGVAFGALIGIWACFIVFVYGVAWYNAWETTLIWTASVVVGLAFVFAAIYAGVQAHEKRKQARYAAYVASGYADPPRKKNETLGTLWAFLVAKKHRVCPLIEVQ